MALRSGLIDMFILFPLLCFPHALIDVPSSSPAQYFLSTREYVDPGLIANIYAELRDAKRNICLNSNRFTGAIPFAVIRALGEVELFDTLWLFRLGLGWAPTKFSEESAPVGWARSTAPAIPACAVKWQ